jgi:hypothetical protein
MSFFIHGTPSLEKLAKNSEKMSFTDGKFTLSTWSSMKEIFI